MTVRVGTAEELRDAGVRVGRLWRPWPPRWPDLQSSLQVDCIHAVGRQGGVGTVRKLTGVDIALVWRLLPVS